MPAALTFRPIGSADTAFLHQVYASTRAEEMAMVPWSDAEKADFLQMQFQAQHQFYQENYGNAEFLIILRDQEPIGRLYVDRCDREIRIIDITLLPAFRNQGIGSALLQDILAEGQQTNLPVRIHVEHYNRALSLYQRLNFRQIDDHGIYYLMEWVPDSQPPS